MFDVTKIEINGAFYELFESTFGEDFFGIVASLKSTPRIQSLRKKKEDELSAEQKEELFAENLRMATIMKKQTSRISYIGSKLYKKDFKCSYEDYLSWLTTTDASDFLDTDVIQAVWGKVTADQTAPKSVKNV